MQESRLLVIVSLLDKSTFLQSVDEFLEGRVGKIAGRPLGNSVELQGVGEFHGSKFYGQYFGVLSAGSWAVLGAYQGQCFVGIASASVNDGPRVVAVGIKDWHGWPEPAEECYPGIVL